MAKKITEPQWLNLPEEHDYPAAASYLNLTFGPKKVSKIVSSLRKSKVSHFKAKDILELQDFLCWVSVTRM